MSKIANKFCEYCLINLWESYFPRHELTKKHEKNVELVESYIPQRRPANWVQFMNQKPQLPSYYTVNGQPNMIITDFGHMYAHHVHKIIKDLLESGSITPPFNYSYMLATSEWKYITLNTYESALETLSKWKAIIDGEY